MRNRQNVDLLVRHLAKLSRDPVHMAGAALVEFSREVQSRMERQGVSEKDLALKSGLSLRKIKSVLYPPLNPITTVRDLSFVAKSLGSDVSIGLRKN